MRSVKHDRVFHIYVAGTQINVLHNDQCETSIKNNPTQQSQGTESGNNMSDSKMEWATKGDTPKIMIMGSSQDTLTGKIRTRSGEISHRLERLGIDT